MWCFVTDMELVDIEVADVVPEIVIRVIETMGENPVSLESGSFLSEFTGSSSTPTSKPLTPDMSPIIHPTNDLYEMKGKENVVPFNVNNSDIQGPKSNKFIAPYKDRGIVQVGKKQLLGLEERT